MGDQGGEHVWTKRGSRVQLPSLPRPSRATLLRAIPSVGVVSLSLVGLLAVPAGSPPPPPAVAAAPAASQSSQPVIDVPVPDASPSEFVTQDPDPPHCEAVARAVSTPIRHGTIVFSSIDRTTISLYDPRTGGRRVLLNGNFTCAFESPRFIDDHSITYRMDGPYIAENGSFIADLTTGKFTRVAGSRFDWEWLAGSALSPGGALLAELGEVGGAKAFTLRVTNTATGKLLYKRSLGYVCYCDGGWIPQELGWSADGSFLFVSVPSADYGNEVYLLNLEGQNVRSPVEGGAYPRWIGSSRAFIYQDAKGNWARVDSLGAAPRTFIRTSPHLADPSLSPDLTRVAFWDSEKLNIVVFDFRAGSIKRFGTNRGNPFWLDDNTLVITGVKTCQCEGLDYTGLNWSLTLSTGKTRRIAVNPSNADVLR